MILKHRSSERERCNRDFYNVALVPIARLKALYVEEGDKVEQGQIVAELDNTVAVMNVHSAKSALVNAIAERQRVEAGTPTGLLAERPLKTRLNQDGLEKVLRERSNQGGYLSQAGRRRICLPAGPGGCRR